MKFQKSFNRIFILYEEIFLFKENFIELSLKLLITQVNMKVNKYINKFYPEITLFFQYVKKYVFFLFLKNFTN